VTVTETLTTADARKLRGGRRPRDDRRPMTLRRWMRKYLIGIIAILVSIVVFIVPFVFVLLEASKTPKEAGLVQFTLPTEWMLWQNIVDVVSANDYTVVWAFFNSLTLTVVSVTIMVVFAAMVGYVLQRKRSRWNPVINFFVLAALIVPPAVVPTIWVLQGVGLFKTLPGLILVEATFGLAFCVLLFRAFVATIPKELDEAAIIDGASWTQTLTMIFIPVALPGIIAATIFAFTVSWAQFLYPLAFTTSASELVLPVGIITSLIKGDVFNWGQIMTGALLGAAPPLIIYAFLIDYYIAGLTAGATKG
jgi:raffinose/stachyose/melibiose transport system permease protein